MNQMSPVNVAVNGRTYAWPRVPAIAICLAGCEPAYLDEAIKAGLMPALLLMVCNLGAAYYVAVKRGYPKGTFPGWDILLHSFAAALPGLLIVVIILAGITTGVFTAVAGSAAPIAWGR